MITYPLNNILYSAEDAELFHCTRTSGVFSADDEFAVSVTGADNTVTIGPGIAWIRNSRFSGKVAANKTSVSLDMGLADGSYTRIDAVVIQFDANANQTAIVVKQGVAASSPVPPEVVRTEAVYELHLYHVRRAAGAAVVSAADITDIRQDRNYCGVMMDDVTNIDENKFLAKTAYDPTGTVEAAGGIPAYVSKNAPKTIVVDSVTNTSKTFAASAASVKKAYDLAYKHSARSFVEPALTYEPSVGCSDVQTDGTQWTKAYGNIICVQVPVRVTPNGTVSEVSFFVAGLPEYYCLITGTEDIYNPYTTYFATEHVEAVATDDNGVPAFYVTLKLKESRDAPFTFDLRFSYIANDL